MSRFKVYATVEICLPAEDEEDAFSKAMDFLVDAALRTKDVDVYAEEIDTTQVS